MDNKDTLFIGNEECRSYWEGKYEQALNNMKNREKNGRVLIEVAAQHPLLDGKYPAEEFAARLKFAKEIFEKEQAEHRDVMIYVPGSVHNGYNGADKVSLSYAGVQYLHESMGIPSCYLMGEELNERYKGNDGVYNSADECYVAAKYFFDEDFEKLICVCSPTQAQRKMLYYIEFGAFPYLYTVPVDELAHNFIFEIFQAVPNVLVNDHSAQDRDSAEFLRTRLERKPGFKQHD